MKMWKRATLRSFVLIEGKEKVRVFSREWNKGKEEVFKMILLQRFSLAEEE